MTSSNSIFFKRLNIKIHFIGFFITMSFASFHIEATNNNDTILTSWQNGVNKTKIIQFVHDVTNTSSPSFVPPQDRVVVIDNDGTLWTEKPFYPQVAFLFEQINHSVTQNKVDTSDPFIQAVVKKDFVYLSTFSKSQIMENLLKPIAGQLVTEYQKSVADFMTMEQHPRFKQPFAQMVYVPMLELIKYLKTKQFDVYIVSGGGTDFVRAISQDYYGIPPDHVLGSRTKNSNENTTLPNKKGHMLVNGLNVDKNKVINIEQYIGKQPLIAIGNSTGDLEMLANTATQKRKSLTILIVHDDSQREYTYTQGAEEVQKQATKSNWLKVSMKNDFKSVFSFD